MMNQLDINQNFKERILEKLKYRGYKRIVYAYKELS